MDVEVIYTAQGWGVFVDGVLQSTFDDEEDALEEAEWLLWETFKEGDE